MSSPPQVKYQAIPRKEPNLRQKKVFAEMVVNGGNASKAMISAGYSPAYAKNPQKLLRCPSFKETLDLIQDSDLLLKAREIALGSDSRACLGAIDMLFKLKDRYPAGKLKIQEYEEELNALKFEPKAEPVPNEPNHYQAPNEAPNDNPLP